MQEMQRSKCLMSNYVPIHIPAEVMNNEGNE